MKVKLSQDPERNVTIIITTANQGGASASDYSVPGSVAFASGETEKTITFTAASDSDNDDGESVKLGFGSPLPTGVSAGTTNEATVSITDDDLPSVTASFGATAYTAAEGDGVTVKVTLSAAPERSVTIPITRDNQGRSVQFRLLRGAGGYHLRGRRHREDLHLHRRRRLRQR